MTEYFVSPTGYNDDPGSIDRPLQTIQRCANVAQPGDTCYIREGVYRELVKPQNSGLPNAPITFETYNGEQVVISATKSIEGEWQKHEGGIYKVTLDSTWDLGIGQNQLFVDSEMAIEARWPNIDRAVDLTRDNHIISSGGGLLKDPSASSKSGYYRALAYYKSPELAQFSEGFWDDAYISFVPGHEWWGNVGTVTQCTSGRVEFQFDFPSDWLNYHQPSRNDPFYLWGIYEALDTEQEWFFDIAGSQGELYTLYYMPPGGSLENKTIELKSRSEVFDLSDRSHIHVKDLQFFGGAIRMNPNSSDNILDGITSDYAGHGQGLTYAYPAIIINGNHNQLINSRVGNTASEALNVKGNGHTIANNVFHDLGYVTATSDGIQFYQGASQILFTHNTIFNSGGIGVSATAKNSKITYNHVWNTGRQKTDTAAINAWNAGDAEGTEIAYNLIHDVLAYLDNTQHHGGTGIRLDSGGATLGNSNYTIHDNIVFDTSTKDSIAIWGLTNTADNYKKAQIYVQNNTVDSSILLFDGDGRSHAGVTLRNNLADRYRLATTSPPKIPDGATVEDNLFLNHVENNFSWRDARDAGFSNGRSLTTAFFPLLDSGEVFLPFNNSSLNIGDRRIGADYFVPGALILDKHLSDIKATLNEQTPSKLTLTGLPLGRILPDTFQVKVGENTRATNCVNLIDRTGQTTAICEINLADSTENKSVYASLDGGTFTQLHQITQHKSSAAKSIPKYSIVVITLVIGTILLTKIVSRHFSKVVTKAD